MHRFVLFVILVLIGTKSAAAMSRVQVKKTMTIFKNQCMPKTGVKDEKVGQIEQGVFIEEHNVMCYISCVYKTGLVVKNERLDRELISKQIDIMYPPELKDKVKSYVEKCIEIQDKYSDRCEGIFHAVKCVYESDPSSFIFP